MHFIVSITKIIRYYFFYKKRGVQNLNSQRKSDVIRVSVVIDNDLDHAIKKLAERKGSSQSSVIREMIIYYLENHDSISEKIDRLERELGLVTESVKLLMKQLQE